MLKRIVTGVGLIGVVLAVLLGLRQVGDTVGVYLVSAFCYIIAMTGAYEMYKSLKKSELNPMPLPIIISAVALLPLALFWGEKGLILALILGMCAGGINFTFAHKYDIKSLFASVFVMVYPLLMMALLMVMNQSVGELLTIFLVIAISVGTDTGAYFVGVTFKGKKLCPEISPKKTISGAIGGIFGGMLGAVIIFLLFDKFRLFDNANNLSTFFLFENWKVSLPIYLAIGAIASVFCELGDLCASWIKRKVGIKDYGNLFPGHGGVMDRIDGIIFVTPIVYFIFSICRLFV